MLRYAVAAATSLVLLTGLTACGGDPPPPRAQPSSTSTSPSATPPPTPPALPAAAKKNTKAGAEAFVRHYVAAFNFAERTGHTASLRALESAQCTSCRKVRASIRRIYASGGHVEGGQWVVRALNSLKRPHDGWVIDVVGLFRPSTVYPGSGESPRHAQGGKAPSSFFVIFDSGWRIAEWTRGV